MSDTKSVQAEFARRAVALRKSDPAFFYTYGKKDPKPDLTADGYARIAHDYIESITFETIFYGILGNTIAAAVKCTIVLNVNGRRIVSEDVGEASTAETRVLDRNAPIRFAATRARKRALVHAMGLDQSVIVEIVNGRSVVYGEDYDVPIDDGPDVLEGVYRFSPRIEKPPKAARPVSQTPRHSGDGSKLPELNW